MQPGRQSGFTLIELMVTLAVVAVLAMLAAPTFADLIEKSRLRGATDDIVNLLNTARVRSVKTDRQINVSVRKSAWCAGATAEGGPATIGAAATLANSPCDCTTSTNCIVPSDASDSANSVSDVMVVSSGAYSGVTLSSVSDDIAYSSATSGGITFSPKLGMVADANGSILATQPQIVVLSKTGKYSTQITVSPLGQVNVCVPSTRPFVAGYPSCP